MTDPTSKRQPPAAERSASRPFTLEVGWFHATSTPDALVVELHAHPVGPIRARTTLALDAEAVQFAIHTGQGVLLQFEGGDPMRPIVTGLIQNEGSELARLLERVPEEAPSADEPMCVEVSADGEKVIVRAGSEISLRCGRASITLTRDGHVVLRGTYIETQSRGVNRIKGASVRIN